MSTAAPSPPPSITWAARLAPLVRAFHAYAGWLVSISWKRFILLSILLMIVVGVVHDMPPFTWTVSERIETIKPRAVVAPSPPKPPKAPKPTTTTDGGKAEGANQPLITIEAPKGKEGSESGGVDISIGAHGIRVSPRPAPSAASAAEAAASAPNQKRPAIETINVSPSGVRIVLPPGATTDTVREAVEEAKREIQEAMAGAREDVAQAKRDAEQAMRDAEQALSELGADTGATRTRTRITRTSIGDFMPQLAFLWILGSLIIKVTYKGQLKAQAQAAQATVVAESEQLKRQVVEARMAAMQAQVEPHFLFNTLASIDHLIETDPARASTMQKNLIALLRASMPTMREANNGGPRDLGREMAVIRPYLEILKVRMEERLVTRIDVPDGLLSAEFPSMMIQSLVENAIKHGLEPKPEGGELQIKAEIVHGKLSITVADTGLGFGRAATAGTGVGLANIRERLQLLYGGRAALTITENSPSGTRVVVTVPYTAHMASGATA